MPVLLMALVSGCETWTGGSFAQAQLENLNDSRVWGRVMFHQTDGKTLVGSVFDRSAPVAQSLAAEAGTVFIRADINSLTPNRQFAFAVYEHGDCSGNGAAAGGHFNPDGKPHGRYGRPESHAGDLPNLSSDGEGTAVFSYETRLLTVAPGPRSIVGRSIVVRETADDYKTQPDGKAGLAIACGVIKARD
jgi:Cu-Zn family superoxide dismutase